MVLFLLVFGGLFVIFFFGIFKFLFGGSVIEIDIISLTFNLLMVLLISDPGTFHVYPSLVQLESNLVWVYTVRIFQR